MRAIDKLALVSALTVGTEKHQFCVGLFKINFKRTTSYQLRVLDISFNLDADGMCYSHIRYFRLVLYH